MSEEQIYEEWVIVHYANGDPEACVIKGRLESEEIPVMLKQEAIGKLYGCRTDGLGQVKICVPLSFKQKALEILSSTEKK